MLGDIFGTGNTIRLGVTGLSRSGKTVFITSLIANLLERERMSLLSAEAEGRILASNLNEQPNPTIPRFEFENHLAEILQEKPTWPEGTRNISELRISIKVAPKGIRNALLDARIIHLDIVDYPGEWLADLALLNMSYDQWSAQMLEALSYNVTGLEDGWCEYVETIRASDLDELTIQKMVDEFTEIAKLRQKSGLADIIPGRMLLPGELEGAPVITFTPLPKNAKLRHIFSQRFEAYKKQVVEPFFKNHFKKLDRQIVLVDVLGALEKGPEALKALEKSMSNILNAFRTGKNGIFSFIFGAKIDRIAFVATKADLLHSEQHDQLVDFTRVLLKSAERKADYKGAKTSAKAIGSIRSTIEDHARVNGEMLGIVKGRAVDTLKTLGFHFGNLPTDPESYLKGSMSREFAAPKIAPPDLTNRAQKGLPHIRLDQVLEFLIGDKLNS